MSKNKICAGAFFSGLLVFFFSCSSENSLNDVLASNGKEVAAKKVTEQELTEQEAKLILRLQKQSNRISLEEAIQATNEFAASLNKTDSIISFYKKSDPLGRPIVKTELSMEENSKSSVKIKSISAMRSNQGIKIKAASKLSSFDIPDTLAYVIDFNDSAGYAIVAADERINAPILAFTTKGSFNRQTDNPGMALFLEMLDAYLINSIAEVEQQKDSLLNNIQSKLNIKDITDINPNALVNTDCSTPGVCIERVGPLIEVHWGQRWPFNGYVKEPNLCSVNNTISNGNLGSYYNPEGRQLAGCAATAIAQIISYWRYPDLNAHFLDGAPTPGPFNWGYMVGKETKQDFYNMPTDTGLRQAVKNWFLKAIGNVFAKIGTNVDMLYGCNVSYAYTINALNYLSSLGFMVSSLESYNYDKIKSYLSSGNNGRLVYTHGCPTVGTCHFWVIDGYINKTTSTGVQKFVHNNWGWDGDNDDWFSENVFNLGYYNFPTSGLQIAAVYRNSR